MTIDYQDLVRGASSIFLRSLLRQPFIEQYNNEIPLVRFKFRIGIDVGEAARLCLGRLYGPLQGDEE